MTISRKYVSTYCDFVRDYENAKDLSQMSVFVAGLKVRLVPNGPQMNGAFREAVVTHRNLSVFPPESS